MINSNQKGKRFERLIATLLDAAGWAARRGVQFSGGEDSPDIVHSIRGIHIECKHVEKLNINKAYNQARRDSGNRMPVVIHKKNRCPILVTMGIEDWIVILKEAGR